MCVGDWEGVWGVQVVWCAGIAHTPSVLSIDVSVHVSVLFHVTSNASHPPILLHPLFPTPGLSVSGVILGSASSEQLAVNTEGAERGAMTKDNSCPAAVNPSNVTEKSKAATAAKVLQ